jgi:hypothetical protein
VIKSCGAATTGGLLGLLGIEGGRAQPADWLNHTNIPIRVRVCVLTRMCFSVVWPVFCATTLHSDLECTMIATRWLGMNEENQKSNMNSNVDFLSLLTLYVRYRFRSTWWASSGGEVNECECERCVRKVWTEWVGDWDRVSDSVWLWSPEIK